MEGRQSGANAPDTTIGYSLPRSVNAQMMNARKDSAHTTAKRMNGMT